MDLNYSGEQIFQLLCIHGECQNIVSRTCRTFNGRFPQLPKMTAKKFLKIKNNFFQNKYVQKQVPHRQNEDDSITVLAYFNAYPERSIRAAANDLDIPYCRIQKVLKENKYHDFKFHSVQALFENDYLPRITFCENFITKIQEDADFLKRVIWTDEAKFSEEGIFNRKNLHVWSDQNPHAIRKSNFQHKFSVNVFCLLKDNMFKYYLYEENLNTNVYLNILRTVVFDFLHDLPLNERNNCWYQLDGAPAHCSREISNALDTMFQDKWIRRLGPWNWPARSPDLTPLDFFLWGRIKEEVYKEPILNKDDLLQKIQIAFEGLGEVEIRRATSRQVEKRILKCLEYNGQNFEQYL